MSTEPESPTADTETGDAPDAAPDVEAAADSGVNGEAHAVAEDRDGYVRAGDDEFWVQARGSFEEKDVTGYAPSPESDQLRVEVSIFEGPLDLLLHLCTKHAFDIFDIPISRITAEYLKAIDDMRALNLDIAGEFLVMASRLAHIKSKMLLPKEERPDDDDDDEIDPRVELVRRLLEYRRFKEVAQKLGERPLLYRDVFPRGTNDPGVDVGGPIDELGLGLKQLPVMKLIETFDKILRRSKKKIVHEVLQERLNVGARINELVDFAREREHFTFEDIVDRYGGRTRQNLIVTFLAVLEMTKLKLIRIHQADVESAIYLSPIRENIAGEWSDGIELSAGGAEEAPLIGGAA